MKDGAKEDWGSGGIIFVSFSLGEKGGQGRSLRGWDVGVEDATEGEQTPGQMWSPKKRGRMRHQLHAENRELPMGCQPEGP